MPLALFEENFSEGDSPVYLHILSFLGKGQ
jgi:hypothetical protein